MYTNQQGDSLSKIIKTAKNKPLESQQLHGSFQQLYELLSKQVPSYNCADVRRYKHRKQLQISNQNTHKKMKVQYTIEVQKRDCRSSSNMSKNQMDEQRKGFFQKDDSKEEKSHVVIPQAQKKKSKSLHSPHQKLKSIILGKKVKKLEFQGVRSYKESQKSSVSHGQQSPLIEKKRSKTQTIVQKGKIDFYIDNAKKHLKQMKDKASLACYLKEASPKYQRTLRSDKQSQLRLKMLRHKKRFMINGQNVNKQSKIGSRPKQQPIRMKCTTKKSQVYKPYLIKDSFACNNQKSIQKAIIQSIKIVKKQEVEQPIMTQSYHSDLIVSQHIMLKVERVLEFCNFMLKTFVCQLHHPPSNKLQRFNRKNQFYTFYIGHGNNRNLVVQIMNKRWWWKEAVVSQGADLVWTQDKIDHIMNLGQRSLKRQNHSVLLTQNKKAVKFVEANRRTSLQLEKGFKNCLIHNRRQKQQNTMVQNLKQILQPLCLHNHLQNSDIIGNKKSLFQLLKKWKIDFQRKEIDELFKIIPETYHILSQETIDFRYFQQVFKLNSNDSNNLWIIKPGQNSNRGRDIFISSSLDQITESLQTRVQLGGTTIIQRYKSDLLLYKGRKFDIRTFLLVVYIGGTCKYYWFTHGYIRTSSHQFRINDLNTMIHLTNDAIQIQGQQYGKFQKGNKLSYHQLQNYLKEAFPQKQWKIEELVSDMKKIAKEVAQSSYCTINGNKKNHGFELFGLDFIIDTDFRPWLLQVNTNPSLQGLSPLLQTMIPNLIDNVFRLAVDPLFPPTMYPDKEREYSIPERIYENNKFQLIFDSLTQKNEEWQTFCQQKDSLNQTSTILSI